MYSLFSNCQNRFFSQSRLPFKAEDLLMQQLKNLGLNRNRHLKINILLNNLSQVRKNQGRLGLLALRDAEIPLAWPLQKKLDYIYAKRSAYFARPVLTAHPTEVLSDEIQTQMNIWIKSALKLEEEQTDRAILGHDIKALAFSLNRLLTQAFLPLEQLTPEQEMARQDRLYLDMMASWPKFNTNNIKAFAVNHGLELAKIADNLTLANKFSYQNIASWSIADIDGNQRRTRQTMEKMESSLQIAIIDRYLSQLTPLQQYSAKLESVVLYLNRCRQSILDGIYFNIQGALIAKQRLIKVLSEIKQDDNLAPNLDQVLEEMIAFVDLVGFRGDLKQFVRQSSQVNTAVMQNFVEILQNFDAEINALAQQFKHYKFWSSEAKTKLNRLLRSDSAYFKYLKTHAQGLTKETLRELDILNFVRVYQNNFSYILSDTKDYHSLDTVVILFGFAAYCSNQLYIDDIRRPPVNLIPLCETPEDLANLPHILDAMLQNPYLKEVILDKGEMVYVAGPSDLGKEGGIFAHFDLIEAEKIAKQVLQQHQRLDPRLKMIQLRVLYGLGGDFHRRVSEASSQLFSTFQGSDACQLGGVHAYQAFVESVSGHDSENSLRAQQLQVFEQANPQDYQDLKKIVNASIQGYRAFIFSPGGMNLFRVLSMPYQLGAKMNTSSRAESKTSAKPDICKSRAIGIANYEISSLFFMRIFMALDGLVSLPLELKAKFPLFYQESLVMQELVLKIFFALAISREDLAVQKIFGGSANINLCRQSASKPEEQALAYILERKFELFKVLLGFMPKSAQILGLKYLDEHPHADMSSLALGLLNLLGKTDKRLQQLHDEIKDELLPCYTLLAKCLEDYAEAERVGDEMNLALYAENVVLALRGDKRISAGPQTIAKMSLKPTPSVVQLMDPSRIAYESSIIKK